MFVAVKCSTFALPSGKVFVANYPAGRNCGGWIVKHIYVPAKSMGVRGQADLIGFGICLRDHCYGCNE